MAGDPATGSRPTLAVLGRSTSINVRKVLWTLDELDLPYAHEADWAENKPVTSAAFRGLNPNALVPVLIEREAVLWESNVICRYLAARSARTDLLPTEPLARAEVEKWMDWQATTLTTASRYAFMGVMRRDPAYQAGAEIQRSVEQWNAAMLILENILADGAGYIAGNHFTLADVVVGLSVHRWLSTPIRHVRAPSIAAYRERLSPRAAPWFAGEFASP